jgi:hypothetical protein
MVRTRHQTRQDAAATPPSLLGYPTLPPPPSPTPTLAKKKKTLASAAGMTLRPPVLIPPSASATAGTTSPAMTLEQAAVAPPWAPPRASIQALEKLFHPPPFNTLHQDASACQAQVSSVKAAAMGPPRPTHCSESQRIRWLKIFEATLQQNAASYAVLLESPNPLMC